jgi:hypothetical protein
MSEVPLYPGSEAGGVGRDPPARGIRAPDRDLACEEVVGVPRVVRVVRNISEIQGCLEETATP